MTTKKSWRATPPKKIKPTVPASTQAMLKEKADRLIDDVMRPEHVKPASMRWQGSIIQRSNGTCVRQVGRRHVFLESFTS